MAIIQSARESMLWEFWQVWRSVAAQIFAPNVPILSWILHETSSQAETLVPKFESHAQAALTDEQYSEDA